MTCNHDLFDSFNEWDSTVKMGDDRVSIIKGSGMVQIKMHNGMVRKLDCWFIIELQNNLIYIGTLANDGLKYSGKGD